MDIYEIDELEVARVSDEQAAAIGRLTVSFNFLESCVAESIAFMVHPPSGDTTHVLLDRLGFEAKVGRLEAVVKHHAAALGMSAVLGDGAGQIETWAAESLTQLPGLLKRLRSAAEFRNGLVHCKVSMGREGAVTLLSRSGAEITSNPETITTEARRIGGLGIAVVSFGQQFWGSVRNFGQRKQNAGPEPEGSE
jgi:hypothetical protein